MCQYCFGLLSKERFSSTHVICLFTIVAVCVLQQVDGLMRLMEGEHVGPFNLGNPGEFTMLELAKVIQM